MHRCSKSQFECFDCCDSCRFYDFNGKRYKLLTPDDRWVAVYTGDGWCHKHREERDPGSTCQNFWCQNVPHRTQGKKKAQ